MAAKPSSKLGAGKPDMKAGNKVEPTTTHKAQAPGKAHSHRGQAKLHGK